jgi:hypothetical protein
MNIEQWVERELEEEGQLLLETLSRATSLTINLA